MLLCPDFRCALRCLDDTSIQRQLHAGSMQRHKNLQTRLPQNRVTIAHKSPDIVKTTVQGLLSAISPVCRFATIDASVSPHGGSGVVLYLLIVAAESENYDHRAWVRFRACVMPPLSEG